MFLLPLLKCFQYNYCSLPKFETQNEGLVSEETLLPICQWSSETRKA